MLALLGLKDSDMRHRPAGDAKAPDATNYEEAKADVYPQIPDALLLKNGQRVTSPAQWWSARRPEIIADYEREILGKAPANLPKVTWEVVKTNPEKYGGFDVITKRLAGHVDNSIDPRIQVNIEMVLTAPAHAAGPVPVIMELAFDPDFQDAIATPVSEVVPPGHGHYGVESEPLLKRGWGFAVLSPTSFQADDGSGLTSGIIGLMNKGQPRGLGHAARVGLGHKPRHGLSRDGQGCRREAGWIGRPLQIWKSRAGRDGLRSKICHRV
jgi:hypothetical protein